MSGPENLNRPEEILRAAFEERAARVEVSPGALGSIRSRVGRRRQYRRRLGVGITALATAAAVGVVGLVTWTRPDASPPVSGPASPTAAPSVGPWLTPAGVFVRVPVYYLGRGTADRELFREFHDATLTEDTLGEAIRAGVTDMLTRSPRDPDYRSAWPAGTAVRAVMIEGDVAVVDLTAGESAGPAVQQFVWTVTGVAAYRKVQLRGVRMLVNGQPGPAPGLLVRSQESVALAKVWLISPQEGDTVGSPFDVHLAGIVAGAQVNLRVRDGNGTVVLSRSVRLDAGAPAQGQAHTPVVLEPGNYTLEAYYTSERDGSEVFLDDHHITVR